MDREQTETVPMVEAVRLVGDGWTLLILWASLHGITRFDTFQRRLGMARNILSNRLSRLVDSGIMEKKPVHAGARRLEYCLTSKGRELTPVLNGIESWGRAVQTEYFREPAHL